MVNFKFTALIVSSLDSAMYKNVAGKISTVITIIWEEHALNQCPCCKTLLSDVHEVFCLFTIRRDTDVRGAH